MLSRQLLCSSKLLRSPIYASIHIFNSYSSLHSSPFSFTKINSNGNVNNFMHKINIKHFSATAELTNDMILERIKKVLSEMERAKIDDNNPVTSETNLYQGVGLDSLDFVEFGIALEDEFSVEIDDDEAEKIVTVGDAIDLIKNSLSKDN